MDEVIPAQTVVQISGQGRVHSRFRIGGASALATPRENAHGALVRRDPPLCSDDGPHTTDCDHATDLLAQLRALLNPEGG